MTSIARKSSRNLALATAGALALALASGCEPAASDGKGGKVSLPASAPPATALMSAAPAGAGNTPEPAAELGSVLTGTTAARRTSQVSASGSGLLVDLKVREGDFVKAGEVIAVLDRRDAVLRIAQAEAGVKLAQVQLTGAQREVERLERLTKDQAVPQADLDRLVSARDAARANVEATQATVATARKSATDADVRAPFAGLVTSRLKAEGEWISTMPPAPLVVLAEIDPLELRVDVPAALLTRVKVGDALTVRVPALEREVTTRVTRVVPLVSPQTRMFALYAELPNEDKALAPGLFAEVRLAGGALSAERTETRDARAQRRETPAAPANAAGSVAQ